MVIGTNCVSADIRINNGITYDDILIKPRYCSFSRKNIDTNTVFLSHKFSMPVLVAPMDTIISFNMMRVLSKLGITGVIHRFQSATEQAAMVKRIKWESSFPIYAAVGTKDIHSRLPLLIAAGVNVYVIDVAHGHHQLVHDTIQYIKSKDDNCKVIAGNVATGEGAIFLEQSGADAIRVGLGCGSVCTTRTTTGVGVPQLTAIYECSRATSLPIIADGGIKCAGDITKALIFGADIVMIGGLLAGTDESSGDLVSKDGISYKKYRGLSSKVLNPDGPEGVEALVPLRGPAAKIIGTLQQHLINSMGYIGCKTVNEVQILEISNKTLVMASHSTHKENIPHIGLNESVIIDG